MPANGVKPSTVGAGLSANNFNVHPLTRHEISRALQTPDRELTILGNAKYRKSSSRAVKNKKQAMHSKGAFDTDGRRFLLRIQRNSFENFGYVAGS